MAKALVFISGFVLFGFLLNDVISNKLPTIENNLAHSVSSEFDHQESWSILTLSGRDLSISGQAPSITAKENAIRMALGVTGINSVSFDGEVIGQESVIANTPVEISEDIATKTLEEPKEVPAVVKVAKIAKVIIQAEPVEKVSKTTKPSALSCQQKVDRLLYVKGLNFGMRDANISRYSANTLNRIAHIATRCTNSRMVISAYTDKVGPAEFVQALSQVRAQTIAAYLTQRGVHPYRIKTIGKGATGAIAGKSNAHIELQFVK